MSLPIAPALAFLTDDGRTGALMRAHDWAQSPLGLPESWSQPLRTLVGMLLNSKFPMFLAWGPELGILYNDAYAEMLGTKHPAALGCRFRDVWAEVWDDIESIIAQALQGQASYHENLPVTMNRKGYEEQAWFTFSYSPVRDEDGRVAGMFCTVIETTEQVLSQRHRAIELERLRRLFQQAPGLIAVLRGPDHVFEIANDAYREHVGHRHILGMPVRVALPELEGQGIFELLDRVYETGEPYRAQELRVKLQHRMDEPPEERFISFVYQPTFDHRGNIAGIFVEGSDVTKSVKAHQALRTSENELKAVSRRKDEFLAMLAHELRNPLAPIASAAELLKLTDLDRERTRKTSEVIFRQVQHMTELVDDLLDVSRVTRGLVTLQEETVSISSLLADAVDQARSLMEAKQQQYDVCVPDEPCHVRGDRTRLVQVFSNILNNAARYTQAGGHIVVRVEADDMHVSVAVEDDGIGIAPTLLPYIFELFTQAERSPDRAQGGLGLGLALVKSLVELHGGEVSAFSAGVGKGSRFVIRLERVSAEEIRQEPNKESETDVSSAGLRVMVVDDNEDAAEMLRLLLEADGHETYTAFSALDALSIAQRTAPAVMFLDIGLPGMDGFELARRLRALPETERSILIALTGYGQPQDKQRAIEAGFDHHLAKPAKWDDVRRLIPGNSV